jgi:hypothetical protein
METFPAEVLVSIFKHMQQPELLKLSLVCKRFDEIINHYKLIRRIYIKSSNDESLLTLRRFYSEVEIKDIDYFGNLPSNHLQVFSDFVKLKLKNCDIKLSNLQEILTMTTSLKFLDFDYVTINDEDLDNAIVLPSLKDIDLLFEESDPRICRVIQSLSFKSIDLRCYGDSPYSNMTDFINLLKAQNQLEKLSISGIFESNLFYRPLGVSNFKLKHFKINNSNLEEYDAIESFLAEHSPTLESLSIKDTHNWDPSTAIAQLKKLKFLEISDMQVRSLTEMPLIEEVIWYRSYLPNAIINFPNVRKLLLDMCTIDNSDEAITFVSQSMNKLEDLELRYCNVENLIAPGLKKLNLNACKGISSRFFEQHKNIEDLTLRFYELNDEILMSIVQNLKNLKVLRVLDNNQLSVKAFKIIGDNCKNLKIIEMSLWVQKFKGEEWKNLCQINGLEIYKRDF